MPIAEKNTILIGEDESDVRSFLEVSLRSHGYDVASARDGVEVVDYFRGGGPVSAVLLDITMPRRDGFEALREIRQMNAEIPVLMLSAMSQPNSVVRAIRGGATDFLPKPIGHDVLANAIRSVLQQPLSGLSARRGVAISQSDIFLGSNPQMKSLAELLPRIAPSNVPILIHGETGTGKEVLARQVHALSHGTSLPFVKLNCAAIPAELAESELFGHERGAFTGAFQRKSGLFELADGGTIFLDEIGDMDIRLQAKLLQVLQDREFRRVGGKQNVRVDVRIVAATHRSLVERVREKLFREDLFYRLDGFTLFLPALRERKEDIVPLANYLLARHAGDAPPLCIPRSLERWLEEYDWPGNVRQLENFMRKYAVLRDPDRIIAELNRMIERTSVQPEFSPVEVPGAARGDLLAENPAVALRRVSQEKAQAESEAILSVLRSTKWNRKQAACLLNMDYKAFLYKLKKIQPRLDSEPTDLSQPISPI